MASVLLDRRIFMKSAGFTFLSGLLPRSAEAVSQTDAIFASAYKSPDGRYGIATLTERGEIVHEYRLPDRGHDVVWHPNRKQMVAFARRPGTFAAVIDGAGSIAPTMITAKEGRHFYGHGAFSEDGRLLFATENDFENARGVIGIYNTEDGCKRLGEFDAGGIGPHDMALLPDGDTLVVANGGIETHPDFARTKLNIATMRPNLSFIDIPTGKLTATFELPPDMYKLSIRHLSVLDHKVWFACQDEGDVAKTKPLVGSVCFDTGDVEMLELGARIDASLRGYVGSIAVNRTSKQIGFTSPRGGVAYAYDAASSTVELLNRTDELCGIAPAGTGFDCSSATGLFAGKQTQMHWDNHITAVR